MNAFVGIDLGTTFSVVAFINQDGIAEAIPNHFNNLLTPSVVDLSVYPPIVGDEAKENQEFNQDKVYAFFKRDMGDPYASYAGVQGLSDPVDLSALVLGYLKECAEEQLGQTVTDAVITVPAYFNNMQREATIAAGKRAGLNVLRIINEPTAAALAYGIRPSTETRKIIVYDLGGGTFDVSLVEITEHEMRVIGTEGDHNLGGKDWDDRILQHLSAQFEEQYGLELIGEDFNALMVLAEKAKISLSERQSVPITVQGGGQVGKYTLTRDHFETLTQDLLERTQQLIKQMLLDAQMTWDDVFGVILVGGSTRLPMVQAYVEQMTGKPSMSGVHPDQAVALGAAIQAAMDMENQKKAPTLLLRGRRTSRDVIGNSLGLIAENEDRSGYINSIIIRKNQEIPCELTRPYQLHVSRSQENKLEVYMTQGEIDDPANCAYLGKYTFTDLPKVSGDQAVIDITYAYNINGVVEVSAVERSSKRPLKLTVTPPPLPDVPGRFMQPPPVQAVREHLNLYMAFDLSGSMSGKPLREAKKAAHSFLTQIDLTVASVGLIEFSDRNNVTVRAAQNARKIVSGIDALKIGTTGIANRAHPFDEIYRLLHNAKGLRYALVLADGVWSCQPQAIQQAKMCHQAGIEIIAVGFGSADKDFLRKISSRDDLNFFVDLNDLSDTFSTIAQELVEGGGEIDSASMREKRKGIHLR
jgi:molecular chaperone DnaK